MFNEWSQGVFGPAATAVKGQNTFTIGVTYGFTKMVK
jgi:hypothetical protein